MAAIRRAETEHSQAPALYTELMALPAPVRRCAVEQEARFATLGLVSYLLAESKHRDDPVVVEEHARLALAVVEALPQERYPEALVWDLLGHACDALAGVRLRRCDLQAAEAALVVAQLALGLGTGDPLEQARHLEQAAALRRQQGRRHTAHVLLRQARELYLEIGDVQAAAALAIASRPRCRGGLWLDASNLQGSERPGA